MGRPPQAGNDLTVNMGMRLTRKTRISGGGFTENAENAMPFAQRNVRHQVRVSPLPFYRFCAPPDLEWLISAACLAYGDRMKDVEATRQWIDRQLHSEDTCFVRSASSVVVVNAQRRFYDPDDVRAKVVFVWSNQPSITALDHAFRGAAAWAKIRGATKLRFDDPPGRSMAAFAKRLGAVVEYESYSLDL